MATDTCVPDWMVGWGHKSEGTPGWGLDELSCWPLLGKNNNYFHDPITHSVTPLICSLLSVPQCQLTLAHEIALHKDITYKGMLHTHDTTGTTGPQLVLSQ